MLHNSFCFSYSALVGLEATDGAAWVVYSASYQTHIMPVLRNLHWLPLNQWTISKALLLPSIQCITQCFAMNWWLSDCGNKAGYFTSGTNVVERLPCFRPHFSCLASIPLYCIWNPQSKCFNCSFNCFNCYTVRCNGLDLLYNLITDAFSVLMELFISAF